ncbi:choice-of-anchor J domain-containing protein [Myroides indicus]|uniref:Cleaved adhesin domain-containing protein n=1 Tax=Myroides indicus TaxID=1323422 RepID=A0A4R7EV81_9FLAO|nr:choice-of-anchor J domain-containing protein [Myroides indicus]TDS51241.1 cleaved adhesin domain-containing protein [Myroides indicus]
MRKCLIYFVLALLCLFTAYGFQHLFVLKDIEVSKMNMENSFEYTDSNCPIPTNVKLKNRKDNELTISWDASGTSTWEYYIFPLGGVFPTGVPTPANVTEVIIITDSNGNALTADTEYEFYIRTVCGNEYSDWEVSFDFKTLCTGYSAPFTESFNSLSLDCWITIDNNNDGNPANSNNVFGSSMWELSNASPFEGSHSMLFHGFSPSHDDWLISPTIKMDGASIYALTYYCKKGSKKASEFEVLLSSQGIGLDKFTTTLQSPESLKNIEYERRVIYIQGVSGDVNIAWHVTSLGWTQIFLDLVSIQKVDCIGVDIEDIQMKSLTKDTVAFEWKDINNSNWEYYIQPKGGGFPVGSGNIVNNPAITVYNVSGGGGVLQPDTEYEFYLRSTCGIAKMSEWVGPIVFKTPCNEVSVPFFEGFNSNSSTIDCWSILDINGDQNVWRVASGSYAYEGDGWMLFGVGSSNSVDDWLISPTIGSLDASKIYRLSYYYQTENNIENKFEVLLSNNNVALSGFTTELVANKTYQNNHWVKETAFITGIGGNINIAWHALSSNTSQTIYLDSILLEEATGCLEPIGLGVEDVEFDSVTLVWQDDFGSEWEYVVQYPDLGTPKGAGISVNKQELVVDKDIDGNKLENNTTYEFYVRNKCNAGSYSSWSGPYKFTTACGILQLPFRENFEEGSSTIRCWEVVDEKGNYSPFVVQNTSYENYWFGITYGGYTGAAANITAYKVDSGSGWLISPAFHLSSGKVYRLQYQYRVGGVDSNKFEVLMSETGTDTLSFTKTIVSSKDYFNNSYIRETVFIKGNNTDINLTWRVFDGLKNIYIDDVYLEEVKGCPEPVSLSVKEIKPDEATLLWEDNEGGTSWEYYVHEQGLGLPKKNGVPTSKKENTIKEDSEGNSLKNNTNYEYYVRTVCGNGEYSIWSGPFEFSTECGVFEIPFWEGFNTNSRNINCWTIINNSGQWFASSTSFYEGDQSMLLNDFSSNQKDSWLISPTFNLDGGMYIVKFHYRAPEQYWSMFLENKFEVLLSSKGITPDDFTTVLLAPDTYKADNWQEKVVFINGVTGEVNIAWHALSEKMTQISIDNIIVQKVNNCPEPYYVTAINQTSTSFDLEWEQDGGVTSWEVIVVEYGQDETTAPVQKKTVTGSPTTTITGLDEGKAYSIFVRANCTDNKSISNWSTAGTGITNVGSNDDCNGAIKIPVNTDLDCVKFVSGTFLGANLSSNPLSNCTPAIKNDIWFEFTAISETHLISLKNIFSLSGMHESITIPYSLQASLYENPCSAITSNALECFNFSKDATSKLLNNLKIGQKYFLRLETMLDNPDFIFNLCITSLSFLEVSAAGEKYTTEELIKDVLISSNCDLVSNVRYQNGRGNVEAQQLITVGYFDQNKSFFPFESGIVLSTNEVEYIPGPYKGYIAPRGDNDYRWTGDKDINDAINDAGGGPSQDKRVTQLEFDFIPVKDSIHFEYLFTSNSYHHSCGQACNVGALFAAWLIDTTTGEGQNLAKISGTDIPISLNTIRDSKKSGVSCTSSNPNLYWKHYDNNQDNPLEAPIDFVGFTKPMKSETVIVIPGRKYHIKLAVMDFCTTIEHSSAVFFKAGSFDLGSLDLGPDWLVEAGTALCGGESRILRSGIGESEEFKTEIEWYRNGELLNGENKPDIEIKESGNYELKIKFVELGCESVGSINIEMYPAISEVVHQSESIVVCQYSLQETLIDLTTVESIMFKDVERSDYTTEYYKTIEEAEASENAISNVENYALGKEPQAQTVYIRVESMITGCQEIFELHIQPEQGAIPDKPSDVSICAEYVFPQVNGDQYYYIEPSGQGQEYKTGDVLTEPGEHTIYVLQINNEEGCYEEISYKVNITAPVTADIFEDKTLSCEYYQLKPLSEHNQYFTEPGGNGDKLYPGRQILQGQTIYVYASSKDSLCSDESSFTIDYEDCPIPRGISPNGDNLNDVFDLTPHGVENIKIYNRWGTEVYSHGGGYTTQWHGQNKNGKQLPDGTYYYVIQAHGKTRTGWVQINK